MNNFFLLSCLTFLALASPTFAAFHPPTANSSNVIPNAFIIKFDASLSGLSKRGAFDGSKILTSFLGVAKNAGIQYDVRASYDESPALFHGVSVTVASGVTGQALAALSGVESVWPVRRMQRPSPFKSADDENPSFSATTAARSSRLMKRASTSYASDTFGPHVMTGVDKVHAAGELGTGITVCLIDTGIDYLNPILGGCFGPGCHVAQGYDLVGDNYDSSNTPVPDPDPYENCDDHGTGVSGVVGALSNSYGFSGVAPEAALGMYRVFGCTGDAGEDVLVSAFLKAFQDGCDVINLSLGGPSAFTYSSPLSYLIDQAWGNGVATTLAAGNSGDEGLFFTDSAAASVPVFGVPVGAAAPLTLPAYNATLSGSLLMPYISYLSAKPIVSSKTYRVYFTSTNPNTANDACSALPASTPILTNYIVVVQRGTCNFATKVANIAAAGGTVVFMYNSVGAADNLYQLSTYIGSLSAITSLTRADGLALLALYNQTLRLLVKFQSPTSFSVPNPLDPGLVSSFSEYGPTADLYGGVAITGPGEDILTTVAVANGGIGFLSGTSFSSPFLAGAFALVMSARASDNLSVNQIKGLLLNTAKFLPTEVGGSTHASVIQQGAGLVQVAAAVAAKTLITPSQIYLNDTTHAAYSQTIKVQNLNTYSVFYIISTDTAVTLAVYDNGGDILPSISPPALNATGTVRLTKIRVQVAGGASTSISFTFVPPVLSASDAAKFPVFSGWVTVTEQALIAAPPPNVIYHVPYFGLVGSVFNMPVFDTTYTIDGPGYAYPFLLDASYDVQSIYASYKRSAGPTLYFRQAGASPLVTIDLVLASISYSSTIPTANQSSRMSKRSARVLHSSVATVRNLLTNRYPARDYLVDSLPGTGFSEQTLVLDGTGATTGVHYRALLRALKVTGDPNYEDQYESWLSPPFSFTT